MLTRTSGIGERIPVREARGVSRSLEAAFARERIEEVLRAVAEDALSPARVDVLPWHDEIVFEDDLREAIREITEAANHLLAQRLTDLLETAPPTLAGRLAAAPRFSDLG
ncbi:MAG: hypothetical protein ABJC39_09075 [Chloroflexota bacterium]